MKEKTSHQKNIKIRAPRTAFELFTIHKMNEFKSITSLTKRRKKCNKAWNDLKPNERSNWTQKAKSEKWEHANIKKKIAENAQSEVPARWILSDEKEQKQPVKEVVKEETADDDDEDDDTESTQSSDSESSSESSDDSDSSSDPPILAPKPPKAASIDTVLSQMDYQKDIDIMDFEVMNIFVDLKTYYEKLQNKFEMRNMDNLIDLIRKSNWNGDMNTIEGIIGCNIAYFKDRLRKMEQEHGKIDRETRSKTLDLLKSVKLLYSKGISTIDKILQNVSESQWLGDRDEFKRKTSFSIAYFENLQSALNGEKQFDTNPTKKWIVEKCLSGNQRNGNENVKQNANQRRRARGSSADRAPVRRLGGNRYRNHQYNRNGHNRKRHRASYDSNNYSQTNAKRRRYS